MAAGLGERHVPPHMALFRLLVLACAFVAGFAALPAHAQVTAYAAGQGAVNRVEVGIDVRASVRDRCGFAEAGAPSGTVDQPRFDETGINRQIALRLNCTGAARVAVSSLNGGLAQATTVEGYASTASYDVELRLAADNGTTASAACTAAALRQAGACAFAGAASQSTGLRLAAASTKDNGSYLKISAPPYAGAKPLLAGDYADTLTITVSIAP